MSAARPATDLVRAPGSPAAEARRAIRALGPRRAARVWRLRERQLLLLAAGAGVDRETVVTALRRLLAEVEGGS